jgi:hypothetical protein
MQRFEILVAENMAQTQLTKLRNWGARALTADNLQEYVAVMEIEAANVQQAKQKFAAGDTSTLVDWDMVFMRKLQAADIVRDVEADTLYFVQHANSNFVSGLELVQISDVVIAA